MNTLTSNTLQGRTMHNHKRIYLNGFMGSGKSTVGPLLASKLGWHFLDLDKSIEAAIGGPIASFFQRAGEAAFRKIEKKELNHTSQLENHVIAVGGGALCNDENISWARSNGTVVFLDAGISALVHRLMSEQTTRPMLLDEKGQLLDDESVKARISTLWTLRRGYYNQADLQVKTDTMTPLEVAHFIFDHL